MYCEPDLKERGERETDVRLGETNKLRDKEYGKRRGMGGREREQEREVTEGGEREKRLCKR